MLGICNGVVLALKILVHARYDEDKLEGMKGLIDAQQSDVYDMLRYVAYAREAISRENRVSTCKPKINTAFGNYKQQEFIAFALEKHIEDGAGELATSKMRSLIELKYHTIGDAVKEFGTTAATRGTFVGFQKYLYE